MTGDVIVCERVRQRYGNTAALDGLDLTVPEGVVYGLLGSNGAGKTTAVRVLATLLRPDSGRAEVAGFNVVTQARQVRQRIGLVGQHAALDEILSGRQNLEMFGRLYHLGARAARRRADELLDRFGLAATDGKPVKQYSGGMRRRLDLATSFLIAPAVLFLDEPTTGLDPANRHQVWESIRDLVAGGTTVLLTTQHLEEADQLAATISVIDSGRVIATGNPAQLKSLVGGDHLDVVVQQPSALDATVTLIRAQLATEPIVERELRRVSAPVDDPVTALTLLAHALREAGITADDITVRRPTLDEAFLHLTGHHDAGSRPANTRTEAVT